MKFKKKITLDQTLEPFYRKEFVAFLEWRQSYNSIVHGYVEDNEYLDLKSYNSGGVGNHIAPVCDLCEIYLNDKLG